jgi:prenyltransferase beta subunit
MKWHAGCGPLFYKTVTKKKFRSYLKSRHASDTKSAVEKMMFRKMNAVYSESRTTSILKIGAKCRVTETHISYSTKKSPSTEASNTLS